MWKPLHESFYEIDPWVEGEGAWEFNFGSNLRTSFMNGPLLESLVLRLLLFVYKDNHNDLNALNELKSFLFILLIKLKKDKNCHSKNVLLKGKIKDDLWQNKTGQETLNFLIE